MKKLFFVLVGALILGGAQSARAGSTSFTSPEALAAPVQPVTAVTDSYSTTDTVRGVSISSSVATSVVISTSVGYRQVEVTNLAATANMFCAERTTVSTSSGVLVGYKIAAGASKIFPIVPFTDFYCINDSGSASQWAVVRRGR